MWKIVYTLATGICAAVNSRDPEAGESVIHLDPTQCGWVNVYPERYKVVGGAIEERPEWTEEVAAAEKLRKLEEDISAVDSGVKEADKQPFGYNGHTYYPDTEFIQGMFSMLPYLPSDYTETWKTAEKEADGITNVYVVLDKAGIAGLASAYLQFKKNNWVVGETQKAALKEEYLGG